MNPRVTKVKAEPGHRLRLTFANGEERIFDVSPFLGKGSIFNELRDGAVFRAVHKAYDSVVWPGGQDICPDTLYEDSVPVRGHEPAMVREPRSKYGGKRITAKKKNRP